MHLKGQGQDEYIYDVHYTMFFNLTNKGGVIALLFSENQR